MKNFLVSFVFLLFLVNTTYAQLKVESAGVGVGDDAMTPVEKLEVFGALKIGTTTSTNAGTLRWTGSDFQGYDGSQWKSLTAGEIGGGNSVWSTNGNNTYFSVGKVGIGTSSPAGELDIKKNQNAPTKMNVQNFDAGNAVYTSLGMSTGSGQSFAIQKMGANFSSFTWNGINLGNWARFRSDSNVEGLIFTTGGSKPLVFGTSDRERLRIEGGGDVGIGFTDPAHKLHVNGDVVANNVSVSSDRRLKKNITPFEYGLEHIMRLKPVTFQYNGRGEIKDTEQLQVGLIAQDVQKIMPELVGSYEITEYGVDLEQYGEDKKGFSRSKVASKNEYLLIKDSKIKFALINAIKEQQAIIQKLTKRIDELEQKVGK